MEGSTGSTADKKRNKLGYHRTSVACVHCRRRKIRCLLAPNDLQGRCENCIRLKKECQFYPVDQQPQLEKKGRSSSRSDLAAADAATPNTPPLMGPGSAIMDQKDASYFQYAGVPMNPSPAISPYNHTPMSATAAITTFSPDSMIAPDIGSAVASQQLGQQVPWDDPSLYGSRIPTESSMAGGQLPGAAVWTQGPASAASLTAAPTLPSSSPNPGMNMTSPPSSLQRGASYGNLHEGPLWTSRGMPTDPTGVQYPSQLAAPVSPPLVTPAEGYPPSVNASSHAISQQMAASYGGQSPQQMGFSTWQGLSPAGGGLPPAQPQAVLGSSQEWYSVDQMQLEQAKQQEMAILASQDHIMDPGMLHRMRKNG